MLKMIDEVLIDLINTTSIQMEHISLYVNKLINVMEDGISYASLELMNKLGLKSRISFRKNYLDPSIENGLIKMTNPNKPTSKNQRYYKV